MCTCEHVVCCVHIWFVSCACGWLRAHVMYRAWVGETRSKKTYEYRPTRDGSGILVLSKRFFLGEAVLEGEGVNVVARNAVVRPRSAVCLRRLRPIHVERVSSLAEQRRHPDVVRRRSGDNDRSTPIGSIYGERR